MMVPRLASGVRDAERVTEIIARAFHTDPVWSCVFPNDALRHAHYQVFMRLSVDGAMRYNTVWLSPGDEAAAVWLPPGGDELTPDDAAAFSSIVVDLLGPGAGRLVETVERFERARPAEPHYYLSLLATDPQHRGHGLGIGLLEATLAIVDAAGLPAYLESTNPVNSDRYQRLGFVEFGSFAVPDDGPTVTKMWREPVLRQG